jgi:hypothetical protein
MRKTLPQLLKTIRACTHCADALPCSPRPVVQAHRSWLIPLSQVRPYLVAPVPPRDDFG